MRWVATVAVALAVGFLVGALAFDEEAESGSTAADPSIEPVSFRADAGAKDQTILNLGGMSIVGSCVQAVDFGPYLSVAAETAVDDAAIAVSFTQRRGQDQSAYEFGLSDFDRSYGPWDFLGTNPGDTAGTLHFARPDGGQVSITFLANQDTAQGDCVFGGTAVYAP